jgi:hypothetical protein
MRNLYQLTRQIIKYKIPKYKSIKNNSNLDTTEILKKKLNKKQLKNDFKNSHTIT